jgi:hypothetical protein
VFFDERFERNRRLWSARSSIHRTQPLVEKNLRLTSRGKIRDGPQHLPPTNLPDRSVFE